MKLSRICSMLALALILNGTAHARYSALTGDEALAARASAEVAKITDVEAFLAEIDETYDMGRQGVYGAMTRKRLRQAATARDDIKRLLAGHETVGSLDLADRIALYNARETIRAVLRFEDKNRRICRLEPKTGSRLSKTECLTVEQRETRARLAREMSRDMIDITIIPNICGRGEGKCEGG